MNPLRLQPSLLVFACLLAALLGMTFSPARAVAGAEDAPSVIREQAPRDDADAVLYPAQRIALHFDHARHAKLGTSCVYCHEQATKSRVSADRLLPPPSRCDACHGSNHDHTGRVQAGVGPA